MPTQEDRLWNALTTDVGISGEYASDEDDGVELMVVELQIPLTVWARVMKSKSTKSMFADWLDAASAEACEARADAAADSADDEEDAAEDGEDEGIESEEIESQENDIADDEE